jgi:two-component system phosphate regulon sensor histidine kinase PhoR
MARALSGEIFHDYRVLLRGASGSNSVMSFSGAPTLADDGHTIEGAVVIFRDITSRQRLERAKDEFLAVAAHELRSPLASVRSYSDMLLKREQQRDDSNPRDMRGLAILSQQVTHMLRMVDNLLDVSRIDAGQIGLHVQRVNLISLVSQVLDQNRLTVLNREFILDTDQPELLVSCDSMRIRQVLTNLVGNGIKYSPAETPISIAIQIVESSLLHIDTPDTIDQEHADTPLHEVLVRVSDKGSVIPPEQQEKLFKRYARVGARRVEGLGLGLYLCRQFVLMHGGRIWVESVEGLGNTFCFTLPMHQKSR